jgi:hypothetical protein
MNRNLLFFVRRSCSCSSKMDGRRENVQCRHAPDDRIDNQANARAHRAVSSTSTISVWLRLSRSVLIGLGLYFISPAFAEKPDPKAHDKADDKVDRRMEEEANLPIYHMPLKGVHSSGLSKNQSDTKPLPLRRPQTKSSRPATVSDRSKAGDKQPLAKSTGLDSSQPKIMTKLDSLAQTQDKARQRVLYGFKQDETHMTPSQPVLAEEQKNSIAKPVVSPPPQTPTNKTMFLPANAAIWTRNDSVPHRGSGTSSLGGPANVRNTGISGSDVKIRP